MILPRADPGFFLGGGALVSCSTSTPINHIVFFFCRIPVVLENRRSSRGGGGGAHSLTPPPRSPPDYYPLYFLFELDVLMSFLNDANYKLQERNQHKYWISFSHRTIHIPNFDIYPSLQNLFANLPQKS